MDFDFLKGQGVPRAVFTITHAIEQVADEGSEYVITSKGKPVAVIVNYDDYKKMQELISEKT